MNTTSRSCLSLFVFLLNYGCGGGTKVSNDLADQNRGSVAFTIQWPDQNRLIPKLAKSIEITTYPRRPNLTELITRNVVERQEGQTESTVEVRNLPSIPVMFKVRAFPEPGAAGTALAYGEQVIEIKPSVKLDKTITMDSTITRFAVTPTPLSVIPGEYVVNAEAQAMDSSGNIVLVVPSKITWTIDDPTLATLTPNGLSCTVKSKSKYGSTLLTVKDTESGKSSSSELSVLDPGSLEASSWKNPMHVWVFEPFGQRQERGLEVEIVPTGSNLTKVQLYQPTKPTRTLVAEVPVTTNDGRRFSGATIQAGAFLNGWDVRVSGSIEYNRDTSLLYLNWQAYKDGDRIYGDGNPFTR